MNTSPPRRLRFFPLDYASMVGFLAYSACSTATPICLVAISRELSLTLSQAGGLEAGRGPLTILALLLSGFVGAKLGKARALGLSCLFLGAGMVCYSLAPSYGILFVTFSALGLSTGVIEALINPLVQELHPEDSGRYLNLTNAFWSIGVLITMLGTGEALDRDVSWRTIIAVMGAVSAVSGILFLALRRTAPQRRSDNMGTVLRAKWAILTAPHFWLLCAMMLFGGSAEGAFTFWSASLLQLHHGAAPGAAGIGVALFAAGMIAGRLAFAWLVPQERLWKLLFVSAIAGVFISAGIPFIQTISIAYFALFLSGLSIACFWPSLQSYAVDRMPFDPTGVFILLSCGGITGFSAVTWSMGLIGDRFTLPASFWLIPACLVILAGLLLAERNRGES